MSTYDPRTENSTPSNGDAQPRHTKEDALSDREYQLLLEGASRMRDYYGFQARFVILVGGGNGNGGVGAAADVGEGVQELQARVSELKEERDRVQDDLDAVRDERDGLEVENEELQARVADLEADVQELRSAFESARDDVAALADTFDVDVELAPPAEESTADTTSVERAPSSTASGSIMAEFQEEAVDRIMDTVQGLSDRQQQLLKYIEANGQTLSSQKEWAQRTFGLQSNPTGGHYEDMSALIDTGFVRKNNDGSIAPNVRDRVEDELAGYDVDDQTVEETYERVLGELASS